MPRPVAIHDDAILAAACKVFLAHGYQAGTAEIARSAGVSEGTIFKRFRTKTELFLAAMDVQHREQEWQKNLLAGIGKAPIRPTLEAYGRHLLARLQIVLPRIIMVTSSGVRFAENYHPTHNPPPLHHAAILTRYLRAEIRGGRLQLKNPEIHADIFVGSLSHCVFCETIFGRKTAHAAYIRTLVDNILQAAAPAPSATGSTRQPHKKRRGVS